MFLRNIVYFHSTRSRFHHLEIAIAMGRLQITSVSRFVVRQMIGKVEKLSSMTLRSVAIVDELGRMMRRRFRPLRTDVNPLDDGRVLPVGQAMRDAFRHLRAERETASLF